MAEVSFFDPQKDAEVKRRRRMAEMMQKQAQPKGTEVISGVAVYQSPLEHLARAIQGGMGSYNERKADELETAQNKARAEMYQKAMGIYSQSPEQAAAILMQDPSMAPAAMQMGISGMDKRAAAEKAAQDEAAKLAREDMQFQREANLKRELAAMRSGGGQLVPELNPETGQFEMVQSTAPRKLSATEQKNFYEQKAKTDSVRNALGVLDQVASIAEGPRFTGMAAPALAAANRVPLIGGLIDDTKAANTTSIDNLLKELAYSRLQSTFPGAISNAERESLEKLQALSSYSLPEQKKIIEEARKVLQRQGDISAQMQQGIVTGQVYQDNPLAPVPSVQPPAQMSERDALVQKLKSGGFSQERIDAYLKSKGM